MALHGAAVRVLGVVETERTTTVGVALELLDGGLSIWLAAEAHDTRAAGATVWLVLDLSLLDSSDSLEELDQVLVAGAPWQLESVSAVISSNWCGGILTFLTWMMGFGSPPESAPSVKALGATTGAAAPPPPP